MFSIFSTAFSRIIGLFLTPKLLVGKYMVDFYFGYRFFSYYVVPIINIMKIFPFFTEIYSFSVLNSHILQQ